MTSNQSIELYESLKRLLKPQFNEVCFYLKKEYDCDLSHVDLDKAPSESAKQLIELIEQYPQGLTHLSEVIDKVAPQKKFKLNVDDLRPHLPNRRPQESKLGRAIQTHHHKQRPLLCLIHSDECQCSDRFVDRLVQYYLPKVVPGDGISSYFVHCHFSQGIDLHQEISEQLASRLGINPFAQPSEIVEAIMRERSPIIFHTDMCTKNWSRCGGMKAVHNFIEFWAKLDIPSTHNHLLLICLYFNYKDIKPSHFLTRWFKKKSINDQIRAEFRQLENENFSEKFGINGIVLPELMDIEKEEVYAWAREHLHSSFLDSVQPKIDDLFKSPDETIPMCDLARSLREILEEFPPDILGFNNDK